jgi:hypothetical protein
MASRKNRLQAGMSKLIRHVRSYVPLHVTEASVYTCKPQRQRGKSEKRQWYPGMCKGMKSLAGYVACRDRDNWDF